MSGSQAAVRLGLALSNEAPIVETVALAQQAERSGLSEVWLGAALWTLRALGEADNRTQRPLTAMVEAIRIVRGMLRGAPGVEGEVFSVRSDAKLDFATHRPAVPIYVGAVNGRMLRAAGAWADGVQLGAIVSPGYARWSWVQIAGGARAAGRDPVSLDLASNVLVSVDRDARAARDAVHNVLAYYIHRVESVVLSTSGADPDEIERVRQAVIDHGVAAGARLVSEGLIDTFAAAGTPEHVAARLQDYVRAGLRGVLAWHVIGPDRTRGLQLLADEVRTRVV